MVPVSGCGQNGCIFEMYSFLICLPSDKKCGQTVYIVAMGNNGFIHEINFMTPWEKLFVLIKVWLYQYIAIFPNIFPNILTKLSYRTY